jgi:chromosome segregation ATPase
MKSFTTSIDNEMNEAELVESNVAVKQMNDLKKKIDFLNVEAKQSEDAKKQLSTEIKQLKEQLHHKVDFLFIRITLPYICTNIRQCVV